MKILYLFAFIFGVILLTFKNTSYCSLYLDFGFDGQWGLLWSYGLSEGLLPHRDIFYPYGIFTYFSSFNSLTNLLPYFLYVSLLIFFYFFIKRMYTQKVLSLIVFFAFVLFLEKYTGLYLVNRYGVALVFALICIDLLIKSKITYKKIFGLGLVNGLIYTLLGDPGIYCGILFTFVGIISFVRNFRDRQIFITQFIIVLKLFSIYFLGLLIGLSTFITYLIATSSLYSYFIFLRDISNLLDAWKAPLTPFLVSPDNIFTIVIFYVSSIFLSLKIVLKKKLSITDYYQLVILVFILLLEQKSLIKSIDRQITFISFFLAIILVSELLKELRRRSMHIYALYAYVLLFLVFILTIFPFSDRPFLQAENDEFKENKPKNISQCVELNIDSIMKSSATYSNQKLVSFLSSNKSFYSFPGEPVWYVLAGSIPPKYVDTYTTSYKTAEDYMLNYLKEKKPDYLLYNFARFAFLDGVPDYVRVPRELKYLLTNYSPIHKEHETLILKRSSDLVDYFNNPLVMSDLSLSDKLLNISLGNIPRSEGFYKLSGRNSIVFEPTKEKVNLSSLASEGKVLLIQHEKTRDEFSFLSITTDEGYKTKIEYMSCGDEICAINLERVPLFYIPRKIKTIEFDTTNQKGYAIIRNEDSLMLW